MKKRSKTAQPVRQRDSLSDLRRRLAEAEETLRAIRNGEVDAVVVKGTRGEQVYSLSGAETIYRHSVETMAEATAALAPDGRIIFSNPRLSEFLGLPASRLLGRPFSSFISTGEKPAFEQLLKRAGAGPARERLLLARANGTAVPTQVSASTIQSTDGAVVILVATDLTGIEEATRKLTRAEAERESLRAGAERLRGIVANAAVGLAVTGPDGRFVEVNRAFCRIVAYTSAELQKMSYRDLVYPDDADANALLAERLARGEIQDFVVENRYVRKDSQPVWVRKSVSRVHDSAGNVQGHVAFVEDISEQKRAEQALRDSEARFRAVLDSSRDVIARYNIQADRYEYVSDSAQALTGYTPAEFVALDRRAALEMVHPEDRRCLEAANAISEATGAAEAEYRQKHRNGIWLWVSNRMSVTKDDAGRPLYRTINLRDISARKQGEEALARSEQQLRSLAENVPSVLQKFDRQLRVVWLSPAAEKQTGIPAEKFIGRTNREMGMPAALCEQWEEAMNDVLATGSSREVEFTLETPDGRKSFLLSLAPGYGADGKQVEHVLGVSTDITDRKRTEAALLESEAKAKALIKYAPTGIYEIDLKGRRFVSVNDAMCRTLGYTREELLAVGPMDVLEDGSRVRFAERVKRTLAGEKVDEAVEYRVLRKDGTAINAVLHVTFAPNAERALVVAHDVTERRQAERKLRETMDELKRSNEELEQFAYVASHDLQEPLRMVSNYVDLLRQRYEQKLDGQADKYISYASGGARRMQALISDLLTFSRMGRRELQMAPVNLNHVFQQALRNLEAAVSEAGAEVTSRDLPTVFGDETTLLQLFQNLLDNGIKFHGKEPPQIRINAEATSEGWKISVTDNGIGMEPRHADRVFRLFQRLHTAEEYPGTGIGLAVCRRVVERHGGRIWFESAPGRGATFSFTLPVAEVDERKRPPRIEPKNNQEAR